MIKKNILVYLLVFLFLAVSGFTGFVSYQVGMDDGYEQGYSNIPRNVVGLTEADISYENGFYLFTVTAGNETITVAKIPDKLALNSYERNYYISQINLPPDYPADVWLPASSSVEFEDGLKITVDFYNTERYRQQFQE